MRSFTEEVQAVVKSIPRGQTMTYAEVAKAAGNAKAARAVGGILRANKDKSIPCHRVIKSNGTLGGYNGLRGSKASLLKKEKAL